MDDFNVFLFANGFVLEGAGTNGAYLRTHYGNGDNCHHLAANCGFDEFDVAGFGVVNNFDCVGGAAGVQTSSETGSEVTAVGGAAYEHSGGVVLLAQNGEQVGVSVVVVAFVAGAVNEHHLVNAGSANLCQFGFGQTVNCYGDQQIAGYVAQLACFAQQFQRNSADSGAIVFDVYPHILVIKLSHL